MTMTLICIFISIVLGVGGQLLLKRGMDIIGSQTLSLSTAMNVGVRIATSPWVILGLAIYASSVFFWLVALSRVELSFIYPFASLSYVLILATSWLLLGEEFNPLRLLGVIAICSGVLIVSQS